MLFTILRASVAAPWQVIKPGGLTKCAHGGEFAFFVSPGTVNKLWFDLQGGGCCFDALTCLTPIYTSTVDVTATKNMLERRGGLGSETDKRNPVADWTRVFVPYCTGDAHTGNATASYGVHHMGRVNAFSAIDWVKEHFASTAAETIFVTGESAGAVASYVIAPWLFAAFPDAKAFHLADSYAPVFGKTGYNQGWKNWNGLGIYDSKAVPYLTHDELYPWRSLIAASNTNATARAFPHATFASYISNDDSVETGFYVVEGGGVDGLNWAKAARAALQAARSAPNFASFISKGTQHVVLDSSSMWEKTSNVVGGSDAGKSVVLGDWIVSLLSGAAVPMELDCKPDCILEE